MFTRTNYDIEKRSSVKLWLFLSGRPHPGENSAQPRATFLPGHPGSKSLFPIYFSQYSPSWWKK